MNARVAAGPELDLARQLNRAFIEVAEKASAAVVVVNVTEKPGAPSVDEFDDDGDSTSKQKPNAQKHEKTYGQGSGIVIRKDGYILTNNHVVQDAEKVEIKLRDGRSFSAAVQGQDPDSDLAVLKIEAPDLPVARLADSAKTRVGEFAIAIGAPFSLDYSVTFGHVSAKGRSNVVPDWDEGDTMDQDFIQTDANINPGNSGGPLLNIEGEVVGINTLIRGLHTGIGFAIPSNLAKEISDKLIADGKITRPWLGIKIHSVADDPDFHELFPAIERGIIVQSVLPGGPAARSGLQAADVITAIDGKPVETTQQLRDEVRRRNVGDLVSLDVARAGKNLQIKLKTQEQIDVVKIAGESAPADSAATSLGLTVHSVTRELAEHFGVKPVEGVIVVDVQKNSPAEDNDIKAGDIITSINQQPLSNLRQFEDALKKADLKKGLLINLTGRDEAWFEILRVDAE